MAPKQVDQAELLRAQVAYMEANYGAVAEFMKFMAKCRKDYFAFCVEAGFTEAQALQLATAFNLTQGTPYEAPNPAEVN